MFDWSAVIDLQAAGRGLSLLFGYWQPWIVVVPGLMGDSMYGDGSWPFAILVLGLALGEWRGAPRACRWLIAAGIVVTLAAVAMLARASALAAP